MKAIFASMLVLASLLTGCYNSSKNDDTVTSSQSSITTKEAAAHAVALVRSMRVDLVSQGTALTVDPQQTVQSSITTSYPISYSKHRDCNVNGTADTVGEKISDTEYNATNSFDACQQIPGIIVDGDNHVYAQLLGDNLHAELTDNEVDVTMGTLDIFIYSDIRFYSDKDSNSTSIILNGNVSLTEDSNSYDAIFHEFQVTFNAQEQNMRMNGNVKIFECGQENFSIHTIKPITIASDGTFTAGILQINGAIFNYLNDGSVLVTLPDHTQHRLQQGMDAICEPSGLPQ